MAAVRIWTQDQIIIGEIPYALVPYSRYIKDEKTYKGYFNPPPSPHQIQVEGHCHEIDVFF
jgi:hypothetical protein